ncbi:hypothetical protein Phi10:1_gp011 [Cellulophaga phage phi10:1]|uniref:Uncharacterized protein n=1 Tax=Cellulophaga phage phi10:1 TaxID=1327981 RepID=S0A1I5_9CAUD|nr:hypothetical protein Phi10:1_gp011 [Cellulophaga phage phi10:1]AGO48352.1 hypothetical protein Phi10:1_gp011 [Cellulophaga phage phi10:1]
MNNIDNQNLVLLGLIVAIALIVTTIKQIKKHGANRN